jgi:hypothetical protein
MSSVKITELSSSGPLTGMEVLPIVQGNETVKTTVQEIGSFTRPYKVYTALLTQSGGDNTLNIQSGLLTVGVTYTINDYIPNDDFTNVGAPSNQNGISFVATGTSPNNWSEASELIYNTGAPVATVLENTLGTNITYQYNGIGIYSILASNDLFTANKTYSVLQLWADDGVTSRLGFIGRASTSELIMTLTDTNGNTANTLGDNQNPVYFLTSIEIRVYN